MNNGINPRPAVLAAMIVALAMGRLLLDSGTLSPLSNFTPLGAMALFGGCYYQEKWKSYFVPLLALWITDVLLNRFVFFHDWVFFYQGFIWVYVSYALMAFIGTRIKKVSVKSVFLAGIAGALVHWIVSDFGVWIAGGTDVTTGLPFTKDWQGYMRCLYVAIPYMKNLLLANLSFGAVFFAGFEYLQRRFPVLQLRAY